ncbi:MAG: 50S ribosomal protein L10 [Minisyncoccia bacterium]|jgi:large subunit ribosomal protein L10
MAITRQKKEEVVAKVEGIATQSSTIVFAHVTKLGVAEQNEMRRALRAQNVGYTIAKKTLLNLGLSKAKFGGAEPKLEGEIAIAYGLPAQAGADELAPAREMAVFIKKYPEQLSFAGGVFGGAFVDRARITSIASIPGMQALRAQFVQLINSPLQRFAVVLNAKAEK